MLENQNETFFSAIVNSGLKIAIIILLTWVITRFAHTVISQIVKRIMKSENFESEREEHLREITVINLIDIVVKILAWLIAGVTILSELGINVGPLLAGAGVVGFAVGFGAQNLIKDLIAGLYVVVENQYRVGDVVELNGITGRVERISLRSTVLRDISGNVHHIPNGSISMATNKTMGYSKINMNIGVSYSSNIDLVEKIINQVGEELTKDEKWGAEIIEAPHFARIVKFGDSSILVKIFGKTKPTKQWSIAGELRRRLKKAFDENGIEIPYPQIVVHNAKDKNSKKK